MRSVTSSIRGDSNVTHFMETSHHCPKRSYYTTATALFCHTLCFVRFFFSPPIFILLIVRGYTDTMMPWHWRGPSLFSPLKSKKMKKYQRSKQPCITGWNGKCKYSAAGDSSKSTICGWDETIHSNKFNIILFVWAWFTSTNLQSGCVLIKQTLLIFAIGRECFHGNCELWATRVDYVI